MGDVTVKPLVWEPVEAWMKCTKERAKAFGGEYQIVMLDPDDPEPLPSLYFEIGLGAFMFRFEQGPDPMGFPGDTCPKKFPSVEAAKAAAQADYEARICSALVASPSGFNDGVRAAGREDLLRDAGIDGVKWAAAFKATAESLGHHGMDEGWLIGWFCNAIMAGYDEAAFRSRAAYGE